VFVTDRWSRGETVAEEKEDRSVEKDGEGRRRSRRDREQDLAKKMTTSAALSDRFDSRDELRAVDNKYVLLNILVMITIMIKTSIPWDVRFSWRKNT